MNRVTEVQVNAHSLDRMAGLVDPPAIALARQLGARLRERLAGQVVWNINSTERGGGVAELLQSIVGYSRGEGVDCRWAVIHGDPAFFRITKRVHNALHGTAGDSSPIGPAESAHYAQTCRDNAAHLTELVQPGDVVILHDPQTVGLAGPLRRHGARIIWRCHVGADTPDQETGRGWAFLKPFLDEVEHHVFTRAAYIPDQLARRPCTIIPPTIDPASVKNRPMDADTARAILVHCGIIEGPMGSGQPVFTRDDGSRGRVDRCVDLLRLGRAPTWDDPLVVQVSRWDRLKDHAGVLEAFSRLVSAAREDSAHLVLAGPNVTAVADDPEGAEVFNELVTAWRALPHGTRRRVHLVNLPMADVQENAAIVNALQRHAAVVVQKSLREGFGLTVTEAMWKERPVVASAVGGISDQIEDGISGRLLRDPCDLDALGGILHELLANTDAARAMGTRAHERVRSTFLALHSLHRFATLLLELTED